MLTLQRSHFFNRPDDHVSVQYWLPHTSYPEHDHDYNEIIFILAGEVTHIVNGLPWFMRPGSFMYIRAADRHAFEDVQGLCTINLLHLPLDQLNWFRGNTAALFLENEPHLWHLAMPRWRQLLLDVNAFACDALYAENEEEVLRSARQETFLLRLVSLLSGYRLQARDELTVDDRVCLALSWVESHWQSKIDWEALAARYMLTLRTFQRRFKLQTGMAPQQYLITLRLRHARFLMQQDSHSLREIAEYCHFYDASHLSGCMRQHVLTSTAHVCRDNNQPTSPSPRRWRPE